MVELIHKRGWDSKTFDTGKKEKGKSVLGAKLQNGLHDIEPDGSFVDCDMTIETIVNGVTTHQVKRGRYGELRFGDNSSENKHLCKIKYKNGNGISLKYLGADSGSPIINGDVKFAAADGIRLRHLPTYKGVKIELITDDPLTAPLEYAFSVKAYGQNYTYEIIDGSIIATGEDGKIITILAPYAVDANDDTCQVHYDLFGILDEYQLFKKVVDETWLRQAAAPVRIDPNITIEDGVDGGVIYDSFLDKVAPTVNYGNRVNIGLHELIPGQPQPGIIYVSLADYGSVTWLNGKFTLSPVSSGGTLPYSVKVWRLKKSWTESTVTYNDADIAWQTPGAKGALDRASVEEATVSIDNAVTDFPILAATLNDYWGGDVANNGVLLEASQTGGNVHMHSSEGTGTQPVFYGEYTESGVNGFPFFFSGINDD